MELLFILGILVVLALACACCGYDGRDEFVHDSTAAGRRLGAPHH
jgi:hypothetical protein